MKVHTNYSLLQHNTFKLHVTAKYFVEIDSENDVKEFVSDKTYNGLPVLILGDGANMLFTKDFEGVVLYINIRGIQIVSEDAENVILDVGAGENWNDLVKYTVSHNWGGIENLCLIPGKVGAAPVQNIAAYGQNFSECFVSLVAYELSTGTKKVFINEECEFAYRTSIFKSKLANKWLISSVRIRLQKNAIVNTSYFETGKSYTQKGSLEQELSTFAKPPYSIADVSKAVSIIRTKKLPDINKFGTAGSFFKNPIVSIEVYKKLKSEDPDLQCYPTDQLSYPKVDDEYLKTQKFVKIPAARLLDNLGWKGKHIGNVGCYENQALALVNYGNATPDELVRLYKQIQKSVKEKYNIDLETEVHII